LRVALAVGALAGWVWRGGPLIGDLWAQAAHTPSAAGVAYDAQRAEVEGYTIYQLLIAARAACPPDQPVLALSDDIRTDQQGNYVLYPRAIDIVRLADSFGTANLDAHAGGCVLYAGPVGQRLDPFKARLTELTCTPAGCLYRIGP
jgi:hypothetical protein